MSGRNRLAGPTEEARLRVLVVEDNRDAADSLALLLRIWGHEAHVAYDGAAALEVARDQRPDVILVDLAMPRLDGCALARRLRLEPRVNPPLLVAVTGYGDAAHRRAAAEAGFEHYLVKPVDLPRLRVLLAAAAGPGGPDLPEILVTPDGRFLAGDPFAAS
jgi:CheY-like chemotaxis protein